jgi:hypothetical protein
MLGASDGAQQGQWTRLALLRLLESVCRCAADGGLGVEQVRSFTSGGSLECASPLRRNDRHGEQRHSLVIGYLSIRPLWA